jgi:hypothetical protein
MKFFRTRLFGLLAGVSVSLSAIAAVPERRPVLMISIDGLPGVRYACRATWDQSAGPKRATSRRRVR